MKFQLEFNELFWSHFFHNKAMETNRECFYISNRGHNSDKNDQAWPIFRLVISTIYTVVHADLPTHFYNTILSKVAPTEHNHYWFNIADPIR